MVQSVIVVGGGAVGLSVAYHLARRDVVEVTLLERNQLTSGTTWHAAGIVGPLRASPNMTWLASQALELFPSLESETGQATGYQRTGGFWLARQPERLDELQRIAAVGRQSGLTPEIVTPDTVSEAVPQLHLADHVGALSVAEDASVNPVDLCAAYAKAAKTRGVRIREETPVDEILIRNGIASGVRLNDGTVLEADRVVLAAGAWSRDLAQAAGVALPLQAVEHMYVVTEPIPGLPNPFPVIRDLDRGIYVKGDAGRLVIGGFEPDAKCWNAAGPDGAVPFLELPEDWEQFTPFMEAALDLIPSLGEVGIQHFMNGPESFTVDSRPLIGETPEVDGLYVAAGMNSVGVMSSAGVGRLLADWIVDGHPPLDVWEIDIARRDPRAGSETHIAHRMSEAVADVFSLHWPFKQPKAGRGLRKSVLHDRWEATGAVFGVTGGWERGLWYATSDAERNLAYSVSTQPWQPIVEREAAAMSDGAVLLDLSPFSKFDISGPDALNVLQYMATGNMDVAIGKAVYTLLLNAKGGIEGDVTVTRMGDTAFRLVSGAATRWRDMAHLRRHVQQRAADVTVSDVTEHEAVIGVMGATAHTLLAEHSDNDWTSFPFSTTQPARVAGVSLMATRLSFVGELGWELSVPTEDAAHLFDALIAGGARPMGHYALEACRIEKGFRHWGHDLGPEITPLEAGLGFAVDWEKPFHGREALLKQRQEGLRQRMLLFDVANHPLILHDEPIWDENTGQVVGWTTSGAKGARTGKTLALGVVATAEGETRRATLERSYTVEVAGKQYSATALARPPYDPDGRRMRA